MGLFSSLGSDADKSPNPPKEAWSVAQSAHKGRPMFLRVNTGLKALAGKLPFDHRFGVAVALRTPNEHGLPTKEESEQLNRIEDTLTTAFTLSGKTFLAVIITTNGFRELIFYTSVPREIVPAIESLRNETKSHNLQFYVKPDTTWEVYKSFAK
jgi:hypothetical protein